MGMNFWLTFKVFFFFLKKKKGNVNGLLTDPTFHTASSDDEEIEADLGFSNHVGQGKGNLGQKGIDGFTDSHVCTDICKALGFKPFTKEDD
jgi:hypothetical protein